MHKVIKDIEFELNTICNSFCPICSRYQNFNNEMYLNPNLKVNRQLDLEIIKKVFDTNKIDPDVIINLIGTAGEPLLHPDFIPIVKHIRQKIPGSHITIHTNGGVRNPKFYTELGNLLAETRRHTLVFSIDGLEDTNGIYRIGVDYNKSIEHMKAAIATGARVIWKFIEFDWNKHQVEEARALAKELGCDSFHRSSNVCDDPEMVDEMMSAAHNKINKLTPPPPEWSEGFMEVPEFDFIDKKCVQEQGIFVDIEGRILPCCMYYSASIFGGQKQEFEKIMYSKEKDWNNLHIQNMDYVLEHGFWNELIRSFDDNPNPLCIINCGRCGDEKAHYDVDMSQEEFGAVHSS